MSTLNPSKTKTQAAVYDMSADDGRARTLYLATDVLCILVNAFLAFSIRFVPDFIHENLFRLTLPSFPNYTFLPYYIASLVIYIGLIAVLFQRYGLYNTPHGGAWIDETALVMRGLALATLMLMIFMFLSKMQISRFIVLSVWGFNVITLSGWRYFRHRVVRRRIAQGDWARNILIVGAGKVGSKLAATLNKNRHLGLRFKGFVDDYKDGEDILGRVKDLGQILRRYFIDEVFITIPSERELVRKVAAEARMRQVNVKVIPELFDGIVLQNPPSVGLLGELPVMELYQEPISETGLVIKRAIDIIGALAGIVILLPLLLVIAAAIKLDSPDGPVIYRSKRIGRKGRVFNCYKFRTMVPNADELKEDLRGLNEKSGPFFKIANDPRITRVGKLLRKYSLDEIPQIFNLLEGNMSMVGPRPHPLDDFEQYSLDHYRRLDVKPGMTSLWAIEARNDPSFERNMELDLYYIENWNPWLDIKIIFKTIPAALRGTGS